jgi:phosphatidylglycerophosphate synthase
VAAFLAFVEMNLIWGWMVVVIIIREFLITGLRFLAMNRGIVLEAERAGKHKTVSQVVTIFFILIALIVKEIGVKYGFWTGSIENMVNYGIIVLMFITVTLTLTSGFSYLWKNRQIIRTL